MKTVPTDFELETDRLRLRMWREADLDAFAAICADPAVMRFFPNCLTREKTAKLISMGSDCFDKHGVFYSPLEIKSTGEFIGFAGLDVHSAGSLSFAPCVDIGWRLKQSAWGKGYASEAARAWLRFGFETKGYEEILSFTIPGNSPSRRVMERIGMTRDVSGDFRLPAIPKDHPCSVHVLYRLSREEWGDQSG
ncbi:GNAT family N-acetyltransferase [Roseibium sp.]|uniref:GNAT family N-acetyltransferase n=1 Tax=Roseibium sp. TaxID=1936156 RepID=UPI003BAEA666